MTGNPGWDRWTAYAVHPGQTVRVAGVVAHVTEAVTTGGNRVLTLDDGRTVTIPLTHQVQVHNL